MDRWVLAGQLFSLTQAKFARSIQNLIWEAIKDKGCCLNNEAHDIVQQTIFSLDMTPKMAPRVNGRDFLKKSFKTSLLTI